jgi:hypothetical protein
MVEPSKGGIFNLTLSPKGKRMNFLLPSGERTKVRGMLKILKQDFRQVISGYPLTKNLSH